MLQDQAHTQTFEKGGANFRYFSKGGVNFKKIQTLRPTLGVVNSVSGKKCRSLK